MNAVQGAFANNARLPVHIFKHPYSANPSGRFRRWNP